MGFHKIIKIVQCARHFNPHRIPIAYSERRHRDDASKMGVQDFHQILSGHIPNVQAFSAKEFRIIILSSYLFVLALARRLIDLLRIWTTKKCSCSCSTAEVLPLLDLHKSIPDIDHSKVLLLLDHCKGTRTVGPLQRCFRCWTIAKALLLLGYDKVLLLLDRCKGATAVEPFLRCSGCQTNWTATKVLLLSNHC